MLLMAALNAISYFIRSSHWASLIGKPAADDESLGFPFRIWEAGNTYGGWYADYPMLGCNMLVAAAVGVVVGSITAWRSDALNRILAHLQSGHRPFPKRSVQFSVRGLMVATALVAIAAAAARHYAARPETLVVIYAFGPALLVGGAMLPRRISWQQRVVLIVPAAAALMAAAVAVGHALGMEFDKVLMGIFLCWTPQSALGAIALTAWLLRPRRPAGRSCRES
jgi:hypothetical protein